MQLVAETNQIHSPLPINSKFLPPKLRSEKVVFRSELVEGELLKTPLSRRKFIFFEAKAGQGKTTTALQYASRTGYPFAWYQVGEEDTDPVSFLSSFIQSIELCTRQGPLICGMPVHSGEVTAEESPSVVTQLMEEIEDLVNENLLVVLDDLHLIYNSPDTLLLLDCLLEKCAPNLSFMLLSRYPLPLRSKKVRFGRATIYLTNEDLAFSLHESMELYKKLSRDVLSYEEVLALHNTTEGWAIGVVFGLFSQGATQSQPMDNQGRLLKNLKSFFRNEVMSAVDGELRHNLLELSLLDEIPLPLAEKITGDSAIGVKLEELMDKNQFIRILDGDVETFSLHHLFRETIREEYSLRATEEERASILRKALNYYLDTGKLEIAVIYVLRLNRLGEIEDFLMKFGLELAVRNRIATLERVVAETKRVFENNSGWVLFFKGLCYAEKNPPKSLACIKRSVKLFENKRDNHGRVLAMSQLLFHHFMTAIGTAKECQRYLDEVMALNTRIGEDLPLFSRVFINRNIGIALLVFSGHFQTCRAYLKKALDGADSVKIANLTVTSRVFIGYSYLIAGKMLNAIKIAESLYSIILRKEIGVTSKLIAHHFHTDFFELADDYNNYLRYRAKYTEIGEMRIIEQTQLQPSITLWDIRFYLARGETDRAGILVEESLSGGALYQTPHIKSRLLEYKAFVQALSGGSPSSVRSIIEQSGSLREISSWGGFFHYRHCVLAGISLSLVKEYKDGEMLLSRGIAGAKELQLTLLEANGLVLRAYSKLLQKASTEALTDLQDGLRLMRINNLNVFWGWHPHIMLPVLEKAAGERIEMGFTKELLRKGFVSCLDAQRKVCPMLRISLLGTFRIAISDRTILEAKDLTPMQRMFFGILLSASGLQVSQENIQNSLWPEESQTKARRNFDTLLSRLRALCKPLLREWNINNYLQVKKGIVCLTNCLIDSLEFEELVHAGMHSADKNEWWQAENFFSRALHHWQGCFASDLFTDDASFDYCTSLTSLFFNMVERWAKMLLDSKRYNDARNLLEQAQKIHPTEGKLIHYLYHTHLQSKDTLSANTILEKHKEYLRRQGATEPEVNTSVERIVSL